MFVRPVVRPIWLVALPNKTICFRTFVRVPQISWRVMKPVVAIDLQQKRWESNRPQSSAAYTASVDFYDFLIFIRGHLAEVRKAQAAANIKSAKELAAAKALGGKKEEEQEPEWEEDDDEEEEDEEANLEDLIKKREEKAAKKKKPLVGLKALEADATNPLQLKPGETLRWMGRGSLSSQIGARELKPLQYIKLKALFEEFIAEPLAFKLKSNILLPYIEIMPKPRDRRDEESLDELGRAYATGRRKTSTARVWIQPGIGIILVNNVLLNNYFLRLDERNQVLKPFLATGALGDFNVWAKVQGGGSSGQAGAIGQGIASAMLKVRFDGFKENLTRPQRLYKRDPRMVERKKPGQKKARKKFTWVKR